MIFQFIPINSNQSELLAEITSLLEVILWPITVLTIFLILRRPIVGFVARLRSVKIKDTELNADAPKKQSSDGGSLLEKFIQENPNKSLERVESNFHKETLEVFHKAVLNESNVDSFKTHEEREKVLFSYSQIIYLIMQFNRIYNLIYGSQIRILDRLNSSNDETLESIMPFFEEAKQNDPKFYDKYLFKDYLAFLTSHSLIAIEGGNVTITPIGKDFFRYIVESGFSLNRVF